MRAALRGHAAWRWSARLARVQRPCYQHHNHSDGAAECGTPAPRFRGRRAITAVLPPAGTDSGRLRLSTLNIQRKYTFSDYMRATTLYQYTHLVEVQQRPDGCDVLI